MDNTIIAIGGIIAAGLVALAIVVSIPRSAEFDGVVYTLKGPVEVSQSYLK